MFKPNTEEKERFLFNAIIDKEIHFQNMLTFCMASDPKSVAYNSLRRLEMELDPDRINIRHETKPRFFGLTGYDCITITYKLDSGEVLVREIK